MLTPAAPHSFYVFAMGQEQGPFDFAAMQQMVRTKQVRHDTMVRVAHGTNLLPFEASHVPGLFSEKEWLTALLLSVFLGFLGVDRFYVGHVGLGVLKLIANVATCFTLGAIWWLIDIVLFAVRNIADKQGLPLR